MDVNAWKTLAENQVVEATMASLEANGIRASFVPNAAAAKNKVLEILPAGAQVMDMTSVTLDSADITPEILSSGRYQPVRQKLNALGKDDVAAKKRLGAAPEWAIGSVHAVTQAGQVLVASNTGSQLPAYAYGASRVIWVVGTHKIVPDFDMGLRRIYEYCLPLEAGRARKAYGASGSAVSKLLVINEEVEQGRINLIFVNEVLGF